MALFRLLVLALLATGLSGCFVLDELEWGQAELERYGGNSEGRPAASPQAAAPKATAPEAAKPDSSSSWKEKVPDVSEWWKEARTITSGPKNTNIVGCRLNGAVSFMRVDECRARGGQVEG